MAGRMGKKDAANNAAIHVNVHLGEADKLGGFGLAVDIKVEGVEDEELIKAGHDVRALFIFVVQRPYSTFPVGLPLQPCIDAWRYCQRFQSVNGCNMVFVSDVA